MLVATLLAASVWTAPAPLALPDYGATASGAFGGSAIGGEFEPSAKVARRSAAGLGPFTPIVPEVSHERVGAAALSAGGEAVVLTVRRHRPTQRIRATIVAPDGTRGAAHTISDASHSATRPQLAVAADGTAVAAWAWHDRAGWRVQAAVRRPGQPRFDRSQNVSPPISNLSRWLWLDAAAGVGGHTALTWYYGGADGLRVEALRVRTAGPDGRFTADQVLAGTGNSYDVGLAVGPGGAVQLAYSGRRFDRPRPAVLRVSNGTAGQALPAPAVLARGGRAVSGGPAIVAAFPASGDPIVAWIRPSDRNEEGGPLEVFAGGGRQVLAERALSLSLAGGPGGSAVLGWSSVSRDEVHVATRPQAGGPFGPDVKLADGGPPSVAMTPEGEALALWQGGVAFHPPD